MSRFETQVARSRTMQRLRLPLGLLAASAAMILLAGSVTSSRAQDELGHRLEQLASDLAEQQRQIEEQRQQLHEYAETIEAQRREIERLRAQIGGRRVHQGTGSPGQHGAANPSKSPALATLPGIWRARGDTAVSLSDRFDIGLGVQYRLMYNASNLPGPGGTTVSRTRSYDFLRQRLRLNLDLSPKGVPAGGFVQAEFRGGLGGTSPTASDPRQQAPSLNPFNRLQARGIRYGFLYFQPATDHTVLAGILPLSDEFGDTLFSADWDFNIGGAALLGSAAAVNYRLAYLRLVDGVGSTDTASLGKDGDFFLADLIWEPPADSAGRRVRLGAHSYYLDIGAGLPLGATEELWAGATAKFTSADSTISGFALLNTGNLGIGELDSSGQVLSGFRDGDAHTGYALKLEATRQIGRGSVAVQAFYTTGDSGDGSRIHNRFVTPEGILGTEGYWAYTHLLTANGPSDVSDLGLEIGNGGAGLMTVQGRVRAPLHERVRGELFGGWFRAGRARRTGHSLATEVGAMASVALAEGLGLDVGLAGAFLGDFFGPDADDLYEAFSRLQFQY